METTVSSGIELQGTRLTLVDGLDVIASVRLLKEPQEPQEPLSTQQGGNMDITLKSLAMRRVLLSATAAMATLLVVPSSFAQDSIQALRRTALNGGDSTCSDALDLTSTKTAFARKKQLIQAEQCIRGYRELAVAAAAVAISNGRGSSTDYLQIDARFATLQAQIENLQDENNANTQFQGLSWGVGFGVSYGFDDAITEATIVDGVVRSEQDETQLARIVLETHRYVGCKSKTDPENSKTGCGPFGIVTTGAENALAGVGFGFMFGWKAPDPTKGTGFSFGLGAILDNDIKTLADGFTDGQPPPAGETEVRFETESRWSAILFFTRTF